MQSGKYIGVDVGKARVGIAQAYAGTTLAIPVKTLRVEPDGSELEELVEFIGEEATAAVFVGLPLLMSGKEGEAARMSRSYARRLAKKIAPIPVRLLDERLTSSSAHGMLSEAGVNTRNHKQMVDQVAAELILTQAIEIQLASNQMPGELVMID